MYVLIVGLSFCSCEIHRAISVLIHWVIEKEKWWELIPAMDMESIRYT